MSNKMSNVKWTMKLVVSDSAASEMCVQSTAAGSPSSAEPFLSLRVRPAAIRAGVRDRVRVRVPA